MFSRGLPARTVLLDSIVGFDEVYWFDEEQPPTRRQIVSQLTLIQEADLACPIILSVEGHVTNGMHRVARPGF